MAVIFRDNAREEYWYQVGRLEAMEELLSRYPGNTNVKAQRVVVRNAEEQIQPSPGTYYDE